MPHYVPLRFLILWMAALLVAGAIASSSARAAVLGDAVAQSTLGQPLRVAIPLDPAPGELIAANCFGLVAPTGDGPAAIVTARVSLERTAAAPQLIVTTPDAIAEPAIRLAVQDGCTSTAQRHYVLLLDPSQADTTYRTSAAAAGTDAPTARAPGQDPPAAAALSAAARRDSPESSGTGARRVAQRLVGAESSSRSRSAGIESGTREGMQPTPSNPRSGFRQVAATRDTARVSPTVPRSAPSAVDGTTESWWTIVVAIGGLIAVILGAILVRRGREEPAPEWWSYHHTSTGPRSVTNLSAAPVTLSRGASATDASEPPAAAVTLPNITLRSRSGRVPPAPPRTASKGAAASCEQDPSSDALLEEIEADLIALRAVPLTRPAARVDKQDVGGDAILQAIEAAERDLLREVPGAADSATDGSLEDDLRISKRGPKKAAA